jgi:signal transduction histidine kinase
VKESERLTRLINQVLDFQKIETGRMAWQISEVDLKAVVHDALASTKSLVQEKRIRVEQEIPELVPTVSGDRDRLIQVMVNLISNAVKFCADDDGRIEIGVTAAPGHVQVSVKDNGIGISRKDREIIFQEFRQIKHTLKGRPPGSGLGLTITRRIVDFHGGRIWVESEPGQGSTFFFTLPRGKRPVNLAETQHIVPSG